MDYLSVCAIVKDENSYLPEWIEYHKLVGVEKFFIYDNGSQVPIAETLAQDIASGTVVVHSFPGAARQCEAYLNCVRHCGKPSFWLAFIDVDEFICPKESDDLRTILRTFEGFAGVGFNWQMFGSSGHLNRPEGLQIENFTLRGQEDFDWNRHIKTIARPHLVAGFPNCHYAAYAPGHFSVNQYGVPFSGAFSAPVAVSRAQINHYFTRSRGEFQEKINRMAADGTRKDMSFFDAVDGGCSSIKDESILRFVPALAKAMKERGFHGTSGIKERVSIPV